MQAGDQHTQQSTLSSPLLPGPLPLPGGKRGGGPAEGGALPAFAEEEDEEDDQQGKERKEPEIHLTDCLTTAKRFANKATEQVTGFRTHSAD